jgi:peptidoglycan/LPS O-acetylase OafA/YrhL
VGVLRMVLAMSVVLGHGVGYSYLIPINGNAAVRCFFIVSGFYMAMILQGEYSRGTRRFYINRTLRIFPAYLAVVGITLAYRSFVGSPLTCFFNNLNLDSLHLQSYLATFGIIGMDHLRPAWGEAGLLNCRVVPQAWSLETELLFYLAAPFLLRRLTFLKAFFGLAVSSLIFWWEQTIGGIPWWAIPTGIPFFMAGALAYISLESLKSRVRIKPLFVALGITTTIACYGFVMHLEALSDPFDIRYAPLYALIVILVPFAFSATSALRWDKWLGDLSYPVYLVHILLVEIAFDHPPLLHYKWRSTFWIVIAVLIASIVLHWLVDIPIERIRSRFKRASQEGPTEK